MITLRVDDELFIFDENEVLIWHFFEQNDVFCANVQFKNGYKQPFSPPHSIALFDAYRQLVEYKSN